MKMAEVTSAYVCQEASMIFLQKKRKENVSAVDGRQSCSKCHFISALCSVSRIFLRCNNYTAKMRRIVCAVRVIRKIPSF